MSYKRGHWGIRRRQHYSKVEAPENGGLSYWCEREKWSFSKTLTSQLSMRSPVVSGCHWSIRTRQEKGPKKALKNANTSFDSHSSFPSVNADFCFRFRDTKTKNVGFRKRISVNRALEQLRRQRQRRRC